MFRAGDQGDALYIVAKGGGEVREDDGTEKGGRILAQLGPGQAFGEMARLNGGPRTATIRAAEASEFTCVSAPLGSTSLRK